ncbi:MAG: hypothetical protein M4579_004945 [Chaenotheca gracillima]|nr:MAG: hypothetical protein M4579_004945 [Chaenotheca gracillima]
MHTLVLVVLILAATAIGERAGDGSFMQNALQALPFLNSFFDSNVTSVSKQSADLEVWLRNEKQVALNGTLANVAPGGRDMDDAVPGTVIASPSKENPDYYYQWTRDAGIVLSSLIRFSGGQDNEIAPHLDVVMSSYIDLQERLQHTPNPSGTFDDLTSLGEPKFLVSGNPFTGSWGRPQRDGPALRVLNLIRYLRQYNASHPSLWNSTEIPGTSDFFKTLYSAQLPPESIIKADLEYVSRFWQEEGFDLWEEVDGLHFFTAMVQMKALREGASLAFAYADDGAGEWYRQQYRAMASNFIQKFRDDSSGRIVSTLNTSRSGLDCSVVLGALRSVFETSDVAPEDEDDLPFQPWSDAILISAHDLVTDAATRFHINSNVSDDPSKSAFAGVGVGRYPEDTYDGYETANLGNPWFLCTSAIAQLFYVLVDHYSSGTMSNRSPPGNLTITQLTCPFWADVNPSIACDSPPQILQPGTQIFLETMQRLGNTGDGFLSVVQKHTTDEGSMSEQFDRETGFSRGAADLTWSYAAFLDAVGWREKSLAKD